MMDLSQKLSAYLDGELDPGEAAAIEARLETDADARAELEALMNADTLAEEEFEAMLKEPVPFALAQQIKAAEMPVAAPAAPPRRPIWSTIAASLVLVALGGVGGYLAKGDPPPVQTGWLADIADYHAVYASQTRHLVEVGADEAEHLQTWLGSSVETPFSIPDLSAHGLTFQGGRLLVANAKPVAQLMYTRDDGAVIALCFQRSSRPPGDGAFKEQTLNGFDFISWTADGADYVVIGPGETPDLQAIADSAAVAI
ncbi:MAG: anti-sigma factor [Pseudomonadota bacterium]